nr:uncharacterized protein LOC113840750 isoform X7 [Anas platyrhynchos]
MRASGCGQGSGGHRKPTGQLPAALQASVPPSPAQSKAETRSRRCSPKAAPKKMLGQAPWARLSPSGPAVLLLVLCTGVTTQDICSSPGFQVHGGNDQTPVLYLNASSAKEGEIVLLQCILDEQFPPTRVVFCKNGLEEFILKAQQGRLIYALVLNITSRSAGMYTCGYQQRNEKNWVRNSALSAPWTLSVAGAGGGETITDIQSSTGEDKREGVSAAWTRPAPCLSPSHPAALTPSLPWLHMPGSRTPSPQARCWQWRPSASSSWLQAAGLPSGKVPAEGDAQDSTIAHVRRDRPGPVQHMSDTTTYATVTHTQTR